MSWDQNEKEPSFYQKFNFYVTEAKWDKTVSERFGESQGVKWDGQDETGAAKHKLFKCEGFGQHPQSAPHILHSSGDPNEMPNAFSPYGKLMKCISNPTFPGTPSNLSAFYQGLIRRQPGYASRDAQLDLRIFAGTVWEMETIEINWKPWDKDPEEAKKNTMVSLWPVRFLGFMDEIGRPSVPQAQSYPTAPTGQPPAPIPGAPQAFIPPGFPQPAQPAAPIPGAPPAFPGAGGPVAVPQQGVFPQTAPVAGPGFPQPQFPAAPAPAGVAPPAPVPAPAPLQMPQAPVPVQTQIPPAAPAPVGAPAPVFPGAPGAFPTPAPGPAVATLRQPVVTPTATYPGELVDYAKSAATWNEFADKASRHPAYSNPADLAAQQVLLQIVEPSSGLWEFLKAQP